MAEFPAMPLWTDAYLADTKHLSDAEHGRYLLLLIDMWRAPGRRFPNDKAWLARKFSRSPEVFDTEIQPLLEEFCQCDGNWWTQKKLRKVWGEVQDRSAKQSARAKSAWDNGKRVSRGKAAPAKQPKPKHYSNGRDSYESESSLFPPSESETESVSSRARAREATQPIKAKSRRKATGPIPDDWAPDVNFAREKGLSDREINLQANKLVDWAKANDKRYCDWIAVWRNWVRSFVERRDGAGIH